MMTRAAGGLLFALALWWAVLGRAGAQAVPAPPPVPVPPPIVVPTLPPSDPTTQAIVRAAAAALTDIIAHNRLEAENTARGTVSYFKRYDMQVQTGANRYRGVRLHPGTVINPRGATPGAGTSVEVRGHGAADGSLDADSITVLR
jgi:hypothetical protein